MLRIFRKGETKPIATFENFESAKAFDWVTQQGYYVIHKEVIPYMYWVVEKLPQRSITQMRYIDKYGKEN